MAKKRIGVGDIVRIRYNNSLHQFPINTLAIVKECRPRRAEYPNFFKVANRKEWWWVEIDDITLFKRGNSEDF